VRLMRDESAPLLFEVGWEVCRKVGGIYTVLRSKAASVVETWGERYCLIGPHTPETTPIEFEPVEPSGHLAPAFRRLKARGVQAHFGRWLVAGYPKALLFDYRGHSDRLDDYRRRLWEDFRIPAPVEDHETSDAIVFGNLVAEFLTDFVAQQSPRRRVIAHFHEWMASVGLMILRRRNVPIATVFTTHATILGRYLCAGRSDFYERLPWIDVDRESGDRNIYQRYCIERAAAHSAHVFTTVSTVTADEAAHLLKRPPDVVVPNGLRLERFAALHEFQNLHAQNKARIHDFVRGHFFRSYDFDLDETIYVFTAGRYEYRNKGIDLFIEALFRLNHALRERHPGRTVVAFLITQAPTRQMNAEVLKSNLMLQDLRKVCADVGERVGQRLFDATARRRLPAAADLLGDEDLVRLKRMTYARKSDLLPAIVTHDLWHDDTDPILQHLRHRRLFNAGSDRVKVVYHPEFLTSTNPLFGMDYDQFVRGCHFGVFPSYYEPWGYTPAECTVLGIPSVCSDLSGFGAFIREHVPDHDERGLFVIERRRLGDGGSIDQLTQTLSDFAALDRRQRIELRNRTERVSDLLDWSSLIRYYREAWDLALGRAYEALVPSGE
jgi:glycogen(starch) synthase